MVKVGFSLNWDVCRLKIGLYVTWVKNNLMITH